MANEPSFQELWRDVRLYAPDLPMPLAQEFVRFAYQRAAKATQWSQLVGFEEFALPLVYRSTDASTASVSIVNGGVTATGTGTAFTSDMVGRQIVFDDQGVPWYDITAVDVPGQILTLDRPYRGPDVVNDIFEVNQVYATCPPDFDYFHSVVDTVREWRIYHDVQQYMLDNWDPRRRKTAGDPWVISPIGPEPVALQVAGTPRHRVEIWPRAGNQIRRLTFKYQKIVPQLSGPTDRPFWPLTREAIVEGALARLSMYKGTADAPNPYYDLNLYRFHQDNYLREVHRCQLEDQRIAQTWVEYSDSDAWPFAPIDGSYLQRHDVWPLIGHR